MRLLLDNPLPVSLTQRLADVGHDVLHVATLGMHASTDAMILERAARERRIVITADADFGTLLAIGGASGPSIVFIRGVAPRTSARLAPILGAALLAAEASLLRGAIVVLDDGRMRVRDLPVGRTPDPVD